MQGWRDEEKMDAGKEWGRTFFIYDERRGLSHTAQKPASF